MQCTQCQHENRDTAKFCAACGSAFAIRCRSCDNQNLPGAVFCDHCGTPLAGPSTASGPAQQAPPTPDSEHRLHALLPAVLGFLQREGRVTYDTLQYVFAVDDTTIERLRKELTFRQLARDEQGQGLVWTGDEHPVVQPVTALTNRSASSDAIPIASPEPPEPVAPARQTDRPNDEPVQATEPVRSAAEAEFRQLTVMFCDLADSTRLSQQLDPEDLRDVVRAYQAAAAEVVQQFDGHMAQYLGDGLLVYFGWPQAHEDDAQRALHSGLGIVEAITTGLNPRLETDKGIRLTVRLGIHTGPVVVGEMGGGGRHENLATGETVNLAARLEGLAPPNTVVLSSVTARLVERAFDLESLGSQRLKGIDEPMEVFRVLGPMADHGDETAVIGAPFLVGRDEEVGLLLRRCEQSREGLGQVVLISGEAGIGKSSLVATIRHHVVEAGYSRITFRCSPYHTNSALYPVIEHVQRVLQFQPGDTPEIKLDKLQRVLRGYSRPLDEVVPLYAALLSVPIQEGRYPALNLSPQQQRQQTQDALVGWLLEEGERQPTLAMWEDLHWADPSTLEMLGLVLEQTPTVPMLHVLTFRPEFTPSWPTRSHMTPLTLNRLERAQVETLITHLAGGKALPEEVVQHIVSRTDGVPLFVEELTKMLLESNFLHERASAYELTGPLSEAAIPSTLQDSLMSRLDRLPAAREIAQYGAVVGREFAYDMLQAITSMEDDALQRGLAQLVDAELLYQRGRPPRSHYIFKHALVQNTAYASLLRSTRQQVHQRIAEFLEERFPEMVETQPELLAHHYTEARLHEPAVSYWQQAGEHAKSRSAFAEATAHLRRGLELLTAFSETRDRMQRELDLQMILASAYHSIYGQTAPEVEQCYVGIRELGEHLGDDQRVFYAHLGLYRCYAARRQAQERDASLKELSEIAQRTQLPRLLMEANMAHGTYLMSTGQFCLARNHLEQAITHYHPQDHQFYVAHSSLDPGVNSLSRYSWTLWFLGYPDQALAYSQKTLDLARDLEHVHSLAMVCDFAAILHLLCGDDEAVWEQTETAMVIATQHELYQWQQTAAILQGNYMARHEPHKEHLDTFYQAVTTYRQRGLYLEWFIALLAQAYGRYGQHETALELLAEAFEIDNRKGDSCWRSELHRLKGELLLLQSSDNVTEPETCFHRALDIARHQQARSWELRAATSLARLWQQQGKRQEAYDLLAPVYGWFTEGFDTADLQDAKALLAALAEGQP